MKPKNNIDELVRNYQPASAKSKEEAWKELSARLQKEKSPNRIVHWIAAAAAFFAAAVVFAVLADNFLLTKNYSAGFGEQLTVVLPDDSEVSLNPNSSVKVKYSFITGRRKLSLTGQALFNVQKGKIFTVNFDGAKVTVLGTRFSIKSYEGIHPEVKCLSGSVEVLSENDKTVIHRGEGVEIVTNAEFKLLEVKPEEVLDEMAGKYYLRNKSMDQIVSLLEARLGYNVEAPPKLLSRKFTGEIDLKKPDSACEILSFAMDVNCKIDHQQKIITFEYNN